MPRGEIKAFLAIATDNKPCHSNGRANRGFRVKHGMTKGRWNDPGEIVKDHSGIAYGPDGIVYDTSHRAGASHGTGGVTISRGKFLL